VHYPTGAMLRRTTIYHYSLFWVRRNSSFGICQPDNVTNIIHRFRNPIFQLNIPSIDLSVPQHLYAVCLIQATTG